jgi:23S rRNA (uracil1939-C5)-methyltransferase
MTGPMGVECPHADRCAGCPLIGHAYDEQLELKRRQLVAAVERYPMLSGVPVEPTSPASPISAYRVRAKLVAGVGGALGLFARGSHEVVDIPECRAIAPALATVADEIRRLSRDPPRDCAAVFRARDESGGALHAVDLREVVDGERTRVLVTLIVDPSRIRGDALRRAAEALGQLPEVIGVAVGRREPRGARVLGSAPEVLLGAAEALDRIGGVAHLASHGAFVQAHRGQAAELHRQLAADLEADLGSLVGRRVLDLYSGSGAIGLALAARGADVTMVESFAPAARTAERAAAALEGPNAGRVTVRVGDAESLADADAPDAVVVNPPRRGLGPGTRRALARLSPRRIAYVSCWPETLARDLQALSLSGFRLRRLVPFDMIPLSDQVETLAILERGVPPEPTLLLEDGELVVVDKPAHEAVEPGLLSRVRDLGGSRAAVAVSSLDPDESGAVLFSRSAESAGLWRDAWRAGRIGVTLTLLVRGLTRKRGTIRRPLPGRGGALATTRYELVERLGGHSLLRVFPEGGHERQARRHLAGIGHPVVGDARYGHAATNRHFSEKLGLDRCFLHLGRVELSVPGNGRHVLVDSPLAPDLAALIGRLRAT